MNNNERKLERTNEWTNERKNVRTIERKNERTRERMIENQNLIQLEMAQTLWEATNLHFSHSNFLLYQWKQRTFS